MSKFATKFVPFALQAASDGVATGQLAASGRIAARTVEDLKRALDRKGGGSSRYDWLDTLDLRVSDWDHLPLFFGLMYAWESVNAKRMLACLRRQIEIDNGRAADAKQWLLRIFFAGYCDGYPGCGHAEVGVVDELAGHVNRLIYRPREDDQAA